MAKTPKMPKKSNMLAYVLTAFVIILLVNTLILPRFLQPDANEVSYTEFINQVDKGVVEKVKINSEDKVITFTSVDGNGDERVYETGIWPDDTELIEKLKNSDITLTSEIPKETNTGFWLALSFILPIVFLIIFMTWLNRKVMKSFQGDGDSPGGFNFGGGFGSFGKGDSKIKPQKETDVTFENVAGQEEAKEQLTEIVDILHNPKRYEKIGAKLPKGALLVGPPGTGKTLLARAVAGESGVPFYSMSGSEFVEMFVGRGAAKVRDLFSEASENAPCIIFIDEIDTVGKRRDSINLSTNDEREQTLNQLLAEMDGFDSHKGIVVLGATNRPETLDPALLRPGRFDRRIPVELPDLIGRENILKLHAKDVKMAGQIDLSLIARSTSGASGADLANIVNEAALRAVRQNRTYVNQEDLQESVETVIAGQQKKNAVMDAEEKRIVAYHEIGHALVAAKINETAPVTKITIVPRTSGALGYTMQVDEGDKYLLSYDELKSKLATFCGGRAAEEVVFNSITTGAANDIEQATKLARAMITQYGMSDDIGMVALSTNRNKYLNDESSLTCSEGMAEHIDHLTIQLINEANETARQILRENKFKLHELAAYLLRKETITGEEFMNILTRDDDRFGKPHEE